MEIKSLIERIEKSEGADADLGREVLLAAGWKGPLHVWRSPDGNTWLDDDHFRRHDPTASIDAAMTLVPEGFSFEVRRSGSGDKGQATVWDPMRAPGAREWRVKGCATPALALCAAALKARNPSHEG